MRWALGGPATFRGPKLLTGGPPGPERAHGALALPAPGCTPRRPGVLGRAAGNLQVCARTNFLGQGRTRGSWAAVWCFVSGRGGLGENSAGSCLLSSWEGRAGSSPAGLRIASPSPACVHGNSILSLQTVRQLSQMLWCVGTERPQRCGSCRSGRQEVATGSELGGPMIPPSRPSRAFPCVLSGEQKPEAGCGKVRGQPLVSGISGVRHIFLEEGRALFQAPFAP